MDQKKNKITKFKIKTAKVLYTLKIKDPARLAKVKKSLPPDIKKVELKGKRRRP